MKAYFEPINDSFFKVWAANEGEARTVVGSLVKVDDYWYYETANQNQRIPGSIILQISSWLERH